MKTIGLALTLENYGLSQVRNFGFNSLFRVGDKNFGVNETGIYELGGETDDGADINGYFDTRILDFETQVKIRNLHFGYEAVGFLSVTTFCDESPGEAVFLVNGE